MNISFEDSLAELMGELQQVNPSVAETIENASRHISASRQHLIEESLAELVEQVEFDDRVAALETRLKLQDQRQRTTYRTNIVNTLNHFFAQAEQAGYIEALTGVEVPLPEINIPIPTIEAPNIDLGTIPKGLALPSLPVGSGGATPVAGLSQSDLTEGSSAASTAGGGYPELLGDEDFNRTVAGYIDELCNTEGGRKLWEEAGVTSVYPGSGMISYCHGSDIELANTGLMGFGTFVHEVQHAWQNRNSGLYGVAAEHDANAVAAARSLESGHLFDAIVSAVAVIDPLTNLWYANYYGDSGDE